MKKQLLISLKEKSLFVLMVLLFVSSFNMTAQDAKETPENIFVEIACFKAKAPGAVGLFRTWGKSFNEELIRQGVLKNWYFYAVDFPNGEDCECNYREVRTFTDMKSLDKLNSEDFTMRVAKKVFPEENIEEMMMQFREKVDFRHSVVYVLEDELIPGGNNNLKFYDLTPGGIMGSNMIVVNYMDVKAGMGDEYVKMETEVFKPVHAASQKAGELIDWSVWQRVLPYGSSFDHNYLTVDVWGSYKKMANANMEAAWKEVYPDKSPADVYSKMADTRDLLKAEIWIELAKAHEVPDVYNVNSIED